ncbi:MAG: response regulator, partial [Kamptonema sp. SIO4C4]|nr:response regulator [Kamptonema sp. SIO4C4]
LPAIEQDKLSLRFQIKDTGIGIAQEHLERIFQPFEQLGHSWKWSEGTGLGLAITQQIIDLMGGELTVNSTLGEGSQFQVDLLLEMASEEQCPHQADMKLRIIGYKGQEKVILVVDDNEENRLVIVNILRPLGFIVYEASDGLAGLDVTLKIRPDLIILDLVMPIMDGFEMTRQLRENEIIKDTCIIASSASTFDITKQQSREVGCNDFLPKPLNEQELLNKIQFFLQLEWEYDREETVKQSKKKLEVTEIIPPTGETLNHWLKLAKRGRIPQLEQEVEEFQKQNLEYWGFTQKILKLTQDFNLNELKKFLENYLN